MIADTQVAALDHNHNVNQYQLNLQYNVKESFTSLQDDIVNFCKITSQYLLTLGDKYLRICYLAYFVWIYISAKMRIRQSSWKKTVTDLLKIAEINIRKYSYLFFFYIKHLHSNIKPTVARHI